MIAGAGCGIDVESIGSWPPMTSSDERGVGDGRRERADLVEAAGEGDEPVAADDAVRRLDPDDAAQRGRLADRPAGVAAERRRRRTRRRPRPRCRRSTRRAPGSVSCGLRVGPNAEFSVLEPMANSSRLVLPTMTAPAARSRSTTVASYGGRQPSRIFDEHVVGMPRVHMLSLSATGTPASGPGSRPAATASSTARAAARASSASTRLKAWISASRAAIAARCVVEHVDGRALAGPDGGGDLGRARAVTPPARRSAGRGSGRRRRGAAASTSSRSRPGATTSSRSTLTQRVRLGHRLDVVEVERVDVGEVLEHVAELRRRALDLLGGQLEPGQAGDVDDVGGGDAVGHAGRG